MSNTRNSLVLGLNGTSAKAESGQIVATSYRLTLNIPPSVARIVRKEMERIASTNRFIAERDAREMQHRARVVFQTKMPRNMLDAIRAFGSGREQPILTIKGFLPLRFMPPTPCGGFCDDTLVAPADLILLGVLDVMGVYPIGYGYENLGRIFRNVVPAAKGERSSHGYDRELPYHTDNPCGWLEEFETISDDRSRSPIPRYLGFVGLRNRDKDNRPVPTDVLPIETILRALDAGTIQNAKLPEFQIEAPDSNSTAPLVGVPLLLERNGVRAMRFAVGGVKGMTEQAKRTIARLEDAIDNVAIDAEAIVTEPGDVTVIDDARVLHRRTAFDPGDLRIARWMRRCYACLNLESGLFKDRYHRPYEWA